MLADEADGTVIRLGPVVVKAHSPASDQAALRARLRVAQHAALHGVLLTPLGEATVRRGRLVTRWPYGQPVDQAAPERFPWAEAGALLARLHAVRPATLPLPLPAAAGPARAARAVERLRGRVTGSRFASARTLVLRAADHPSPTRPTVRPTLCHGDFHLGQLVWADGWRLIDIDDLGVGDPAWDLARPAAWYAAGLLDPNDWQQLLAGYGTTGDPWPWLEAATRALTVQSAAQALLRAQLTDTQLDYDGVALVDSCGRIAGLP
ncbi:aminoglycoside phosphotransferase family protein [Streptomyces profundus]|nr:aminoglycoside phosphotransferase family protein [Streptomyces sp. MA3_2.13]